MNSKKPSAKRKAVERPPANGSYEELDKYFSRHSLKELEKAGIAKKLSLQEEKWFDKITTSVKNKVAARKSRAQLNLAFPETDLSRFIKYAECKHMPVSTLARAWILERLDWELRRNS